jgi:hypothetical protein
MRWWLGLLVSTLSWGDELLPQPGASEPAAVGAVGLGIDASPRAFGIVDLRLGVRATPSVTAWLGAVGLEDQDALVRDDLSLGVLGNVHGFDAGGFLRLRTRSNTGPSVGGGVVGGGPIISSLRWFARAEYEYAPSAFFDEASAELGLRWSRGPVELEPFAEAEQTLGAPWCPIDGVCRAIGGGATLRVQAASELRFDLRADARAVADELVTGERTSRADLSLIAGLEVARNPVNHRWYGWEILASDVLLAVPSVFALGTPLLVTGPIIHLLNKRPKAALASALIRVAAFAITYAALKHVEGPPCDPNGSECEGDGFPTASAFTGIGLLAVAPIDWVLLSWR